MSRAWYFLLLLLLFTNSRHLHSQNYISNDPGNNRYSIEWVKSIPGSKTEKKRSFLDFLGRVILGERPHKIVKPVMAFPGTNNVMWILSQETGQLLGYSNDKLTLPDGEKGAYAYFPSLVSGCTAGDSLTLFTDSSRNSVYKLTHNEEISRFCGDSTLSRPTGIAYSGLTGEIWVVETGAHRIAVLDRNGSVIKRIGKRGTGPGEFNFPTHIWINSEGIAYIVDAMNFRVQIFDQRGLFISSFGEAGNATGKFARPKGIASDSHGNIYVADALFNTIQVFDSTGTLLCYFGGKGSGNGELMMPAGLYIDDNDYIYVADCFNNRIQVFQLKTE